MEVAVPVNTELTRPKSPAFIGGCLRAVKPNKDSTNLQWDLGPLQEVSFYWLTEVQVSHGWQDY